MVFKDKLKLSNKHIKIDKANQIIIIALSSAVAVVIFTLVATQALVKQIGYQNSVISKRRAANAQLEKNVKASASLVLAYQAFDSPSESIIGTSEKNSKVVLDALPSKYDFPALISSMESLSAASGVKVESSSGQDNEASAEQISDNPKPVEIPVNFSGTGNVASIQKLVDVMHRTIRPIDINNFVLKGSDTNLRVEINGITYYQPERNYTVKYEVVKPAGSTAKKAAIKATNTKEAK